MKLFLFLLAMTTFNALADPCVITVNTIMPASANVNEPVPIRVTTTSSAGTVIIARYEVNFGDGVSQNFSSQPPGGFTHSYSLIGFYSVTVNVLGNVQGIPGVTCRANRYYGLHTSLQIIQPNTGIDMSLIHPAITVNPTGQLRVGESIQFIGESGLSVENEAVYQPLYSWEFSDNPSFIFNGEKTFTRIFSNPVNTTLTLTIRVYDGNQYLSAPAVSVNLSLELGFIISGHTPGAIGSVHGMSYFTYKDAVGASHKVVAVMGSDDTRRAGDHVSLVNVDSPDNPHTIGGNRSVHTAWEGVPSEVSTSIFSLAGAEGILAVVIGSVSGGIFLFDIDSIETKPNDLLKPFAKAANSFPGNMNLSSDGKILFAAQSNNLIAYDISQARAAQPGWRAPVISSYALSSPITGMGKNNDLLYVGNGNKFSIIEFKNSQFILKANVATPITPRSFSFLGPLMAVNERLGAAGQSVTIDLYDISNPISPVLKAVYGDTYYGAGLAMMHGKAHLFTTAAGLVTLDATVSLQNPRQNPCNLSTCLLSRSPLALGDRILGGINDTKAMIVDNQRNLVFIGTNGATLTVVKQN